MKAFGFNRWQKGKNMRTRKKLIIVSLFITMLLSGCQNKMAGSEGENKVSDKEQVLKQIRRRRRMRIQRIRKTKYKAIRKKQRHWMKVY